MTMTFAGVICWVIASVVGLTFAFITREKMTIPGAIWKFLASFSIAAYAIVLILLYGEVSEAAKLFVTGLCLAAFGDLVMGLLQARYEGSTGGLLKNVLSGSPVLQFEVGGMVCIFIVSYFFQMVAFIKALANHANPTEYVIPFLFFFLLPPVFTIIGAILSKFRIPEVSANIFIIGVFYILLASALFASASVFAFSYFQEDPNHSIFIFTGSILFFLSALFIAIRYANPEKYESQLTKNTSRVLTFFGRMILAGCAFLF